MITSVSSCFSCTSFILVLRTKQGRGGNTEKWIETKVEKYVSMLVNESIFRAFWVTNQCLKLFKIMKCLAILYTARFSLHQAQTARYCWLSLGRVYFKRKRACWVLEQGCCSAMLAHLKYHPTKACSLCVVTRKQNTQISGPTPGTQGYMLDSP